MDDSSQHEDSRLSNKYSAPKDKSCPFCGQPFTSSSLGRHLDVYIKDKNPKPPDGVHDVEAIRKMRGNITRRQPRGSTGPRRGVSTPVGTPRGPASRKGSVSASSSRDRPSVPVPPLGLSRDYAVDAPLGAYTPYGTPRWGDLNGSAITDLPDTSTPDHPARRPRNVSRQVANKAQFDVKHRLADAVDTARAAELALRELLGSWQAAKQHVDAASMPFDFDPLSLDFPALTLQCLQPPPTLFSSTQHPTSTSWSVQSPGHREFEALRAYFDDQFQSWKRTCQSVAGASDESTNGLSQSRREQLRRAERSADDLEKQIHEHLQSAYNVWETLPSPRQSEVWALEMARSVGRKHKEGLKMKEKQQTLEQENAHLKAQIEQLNRMQQPQEFGLLAPQTLPIGRDAIAHAYEQGVKGASLSGLQADDGHLDVGTLVSRSIERWKTVVSSYRATGNGMGAQRPLDRPTQDGSADGNNSVTTNSNGNGNSNSTNGQQQLHGNRSQSSTPQQPQPKRQSTASTSGATSSEHTTPANTAPPSVEETTSDQDADAEMEDDDSFAMMQQPAQHSPQKQAVPPALQQQATLEVPRTRGTLQQQQQQQQQAQQQAQQRANGGMTAEQQRFMMQNGAGSPVGRATMNMSRSMPHMNMAMQGNAMGDPSMSMAMGNAMYME